MFGELIVGGLAAYSAFNYALPYAIVRCNIEGTAKEALKEWKEYSKAEKAFSIVFPGVYLAARDQNHQKK